MLGDHTHTLDWDAQRLRDAVEAAHAHRDDLTPDMVQADPRFTRTRRGNAFYTELVACYGAAAADCLWSTAVEGCIAR